MKTKPFITTALLIAGLFTQGGVTMAQDTESNGKLIGAFAEQVFGHKDLSHLDQYIKQDYIQHNPLVGQGIEGFKAFFADWFEQVPDFKYDLKKTIINDDHIWVYGTYSGTQKGEWLGVPATHKAYSFDSVDIFRVEEGKLAEHWDVLDVYTLFKNLGVIQ